MALTLATAISAVEAQLLRVLTLGLRRRLAPAATPAALRAAATLGASGSARTPDDIVYVTSLGYVFQWSPTSTAADNGTTVIKPTDVGTNPGRWLAATSTNARIAGTPIHKIQTGYLDAVRLHEGQETEEEFVNLAFGQTPAAAIVYAGDAPEAASLIPGALTRWRIDFDIWISSKNMRNRGEGARGGAPADELADDPGVNALDGLVMALLASAPANLDGFDGITLVTPGEGRIEWHDLAQRRFCRSRRFSVQATVHNTANDTDLDLVSSPYFDQRFGQADAEGEASASNYLVSGIAPAIGGPLAQVWSAGSAVINGATVAYLAGAAETLPAHADTYVDLKTDGTLVLTAVGIGFDAPALAANRLRVRVITTDDATAIADRVLCTVSAPYSDDNLVSP